MENKIFLQINTDCIDIYLSSEKGLKNSFLKYRLFHAVEPYKDGGVMQNRDLWRLYELYAFNYKDGKMEQRFPFPLVSAGEWECAIKITNTPDFHGGFHGYERLTEVTLSADGKVIDITVPSSLWVNSVDFIQKSTIYKQGTLDDAVASHVKKYSFKKGALTLSQEIVFNSQYDISYAYLTMLPIRRTHNKRPDGIQISDRFSVNGEAAVYNITEIGHTTPYSPSPSPAPIVRSVKIWGEALGVTAEVSLSGNMTDSATFMVQNNETYNKLYFSHAGAGKSYLTKKDEKWETETVYEIYMTK